MITQRKMILSSLVALTIVALPQPSVAGACLPQITQVHGAVCYEPYGDTFEESYCQLHIQGECLEAFNIPVTVTKTSAPECRSEYRVMIADGDGVLKQAEPFQSDVLEATDLHYRLIPAIVNCSTMQMMAGSSIENRMVKLQKQVKIGRLSKWIDLDSKFVTFTCVPQIE